MLPGSVEIDLRNTSTALEVHRALSAALKFPAWYGNNWDAFWDSVTGLVELPSELRILGFRSLQSRLPVDAQQLRGALEELAVEHPVLAPRVIYEE